MTKIPGAGECAVPSCEHRAQRNQLMCRAHWYSVSGGTRAKVNTTFRDFMDGEASLADLRAIQQKAIEEAS